MTQEEIAIKRKEFYERLEKVRRGELPPAKYTPPVYDEAYWKAIDMMNSEEFHRNH
jgi:hypothetical protein